MKGYGISVSSWVKPSQGVNPLMQQRNAALAQQD